MPTNNTQTDINGQGLVCDPRAITLSEKTGAMDSSKVPRLTEAAEKNTTMPEGGVAVTESVTCGVCEEDMGHTIRQPVALPACGHTFCRKCLTQLLHTYGQHFHCPICRTPHQGQDVASLPVNYLVLSLISTPLQNNKRNAFTETSGKINIKGTEKFSGEDDHHNPLPDPSQNMELMTMTNNEGEKERDTISLHSNQDHRQGLDDKQHILRSDVEGRRRGRCQISRCQKVCLMASLVLLMLVALGAGVAIGSAPAIINQLGFTEKGVARDTYASRLMSSTARANNGTIPQDSMVAWLQNAGHKGLSRKHRTYMGLSGAGVGLATGAILVGVVVGVVAVVKGCTRTHHRCPHSP